MQLVGAHPGGREELLCALLGTRHDGSRLGPGPLERLLDLGARRVGELGRVVARLLEQPGRPRLGLAQLATRLLVRLGDDVPRLALRGGENLRALALALLTEAVDLGVALLELVLAVPHLLLGPPELRCGRVRRVALERVGELGGRADEMQRVHAHGVARRVDVCALAGGLQDTELSL